MSFQSEEGGEMSKLKQHNEEELTTPRPTNEVSTEDEEQAVDENDDQLHHNPEGNKRPRGDSIYSIPDITLPEYIKNSEDGNSGNAQEVKSAVHANRTYAFRMSRSSRFAFRRGSRYHFDERVCFGPIGSSPVPTF